MPKKKTYSEKLKDPRWQKKRLQVFERDAFTCVECNSKEETLHVHHLKYEKGKNPWEYGNEDLVTWCENCHEMFHELRALGDCIHACMHSKLQSPLYCENIVHLGGTVDNKRAVLSGCKIKIHCKYKKYVSLAGESRAFLD